MPYPFALSGAHERSSNARCEMRRAGLLWRIKENSTRRKPHLWTSNHAKVAQSATECYSYFMATSTTQGVKLESDVRARLQTLGKIKKRSPHFLMKEAITLYLEREELYERERAEDDARWERYQLTGEAVSDKVATAWLEGLAQGKATPCPK